MLLAHNQDGIVSQAEPHLTGTCPGCKSPVIAKCGKKMVWHWAHARDAECDSWTEHETDWHRNWKLKFPLEWCERSIGEHRADVLNPYGRVIEFQHSPLSFEEMRERERFYGDMFWVVDIQAAADRFDVNGHNQPATFLWTRPKRTWAYARKPVLLDLGPDRPDQRRLFYVSKWGKPYSELEETWHSFPTQYVDGAGEWVGGEDFVEMFTQNRARRAA